MFSSRLVHQSTSRLILTPPRQANWPCPLGNRLTHQPVKTRFPLLLAQRRCYAQAAKPPPRAREEELKRQAKAAAAGGKHHEIPEKLLIYHAGTGRITFLAMVKVTTLFIGAFFAFLVVPSYVKADKPEWETAGVALSGLIPVVFITFTTSPFVTHIHIRLPASARASRSALERFVLPGSGSGGGIPPSAELTVTTMSAIAKPRYSSLQAGHLRPARQRFGIVNYARRDAAAAAENADRRWWNFRAVTRFCVQDAAAGRKGKRGEAQKKKKSRALTEAWIWDAIKEKIAQREAAAAAAAAAATATKSA